LIAKSRIKIRPHFLGLRQVMLTALDDDLLRN
jgi:hypothetical protein